MSTPEKQAPEELTGGELVYRATDSATMSLRRTDDGGRVLEGRMMPYNEWTEVRSAVEGHFMERFAPGALAKTMRERGRQIKVMFEHGLDSLGRQSIASPDGFEDRDDGAYYSASLFRSVPELIVEGLERGTYGASIRFRPVKWDRERSPEPSELNPNGIPEHTIREAAVVEFSVVTFPQYEGTTASVRSLTDEVSARQLMADPGRLLEIIRTLNLNTNTSEIPVEPQHSGREEPVEPAPQRSRSTQQTRDYLSNEEGAPKWLL